MPEIKGKKSTPPAVEVLPLKAKAMRFHESRMVKSLGIYPYFREISSAQDTVVTIGGRQVLMFGSNSYLGLTNHPEIKKAAIDAIERYGTGCSGSRFLNGSLDIHRMLEEELAELVGLPGAIVFSTGFQANLGAISTMVDRGEYDHRPPRPCEHHRRLPAQLRRKPVRPQRYGGPDRVPRVLPPESGKLVVVDGVYSMEG
jgi:7-keto-8-aminopelargonate synthetase-like enzyme